MEDRHAAAHPMEVHTEDHHHIMVHPRITVHHLEVHRHIMDRHHQGAHLHAAHHHQEDHHLNADHQMVLLHAVGFKKQ